MYTNKYIHVPYIIKEGDTLPNIALRLMGDAGLFSKIATLNNLKESILSPGDTLMIPVLITPKLMDSPAVQAALDNLQCKEYPTLEGARRIYTQLGSSIIPTGDYEDRIDALGKRVGITTFAEELGILNHAQFLEEIEKLKTQFRS